MTKTISIIVAAGLLLGLSAFTVHQYGTINNQGSMIQKQQKELQIMANNLENQLSEKQVLEEKNVELELEVQRLRDSINVLRGQIDQLRGKVRRQQKTIRSIRNKLNKIMNDYAALKQQISTLSRQETVDRDRIQALEQEKLLLRQEMEQLNIQKDKEVVAQSQAEKEIMARQVREAKYLRRSNIIRNTKVNFQRISLRKKKFGRPLTKVKKNHKNWKYTTIEFYLENQDPRLLLDERFVVRIVDTDTNELLSYIETNPNFPNSDKDTKGMEFQFDGNMVEVSYHNNQKKAGKNYEVQIYYISDDNKEYLLTNGSKMILKNRKATGI
ncbi:MAG: hypothetical protein AAGG75_10955 [Bacteroidota bacterium]